jgi:hypothetical protein
MLEQGHGMPFRYIVHNFLDSPSIFLTDGVAVPDELATPALQHLPFRHFSTTDETGVRFWQSVKKGRQTVARVMFVDASDQSTVRSHLLGELAVLAKNRGFSWMTIFIRNPIVLTDQPNHVYRVEQVSSKCVIPVFFYLQSENSCKGECMFGENDKIKNQPVTFAKSLDDCMEFDLGDGILHHGCSQLMELLVVRAKKHSVRTPMVAVHYRGKKVHMF